MKSMVPRTIQNLQTLRRQVADLCHSEIESSEEWRARLRRKLHSQLLRKAPVSESALSSLLPPELTCESIDVFSRRFAGLVDSMRQGHEPQLWKGEESWHTVQCTDVFPVFLKRSVVFSSVVLDVMEGRASGTMPSVIVPEWKLCDLTAKAMSKSRTAEPYVYDMAGMYFGALLSTDDKGRVRIDDVEVTGGERTWNRSLMEVRDSRCIKGLFSECDYCRMGRNECSSAYHSLPFGRGACKQCGHPKRYVTPQSICWKCVREDNLPDVNREGNIEEACQNELV